MHLPEKQSLSTPATRGFQVSARQQDSDAPSEQHKERGYWRRFVEEYRKNYCPRTSPPIVLPSTPSDEEKYSFVKMKRPLLVFCDLLALASLGYGSWNFALASAAYAWFTLYVTINELYILTALFVTAIGKELNISSHRKLLEDHGISDDRPTPTVDIYLPVCNEPLVVLENTWEYIIALEYPKNKISIFVLDDGTDDDGAGDAVKLLAKRFEFNYFRRPNRPQLKKSGNLRFAFSQTTGDFFTIFDADFCPRSDFLLETMPYLVADGKRAIVQTPQFFRASNQQTWTEQGAGASQELIYRLMEPSRDRWGAAICVGSNAVYRRAAFEPIGGTFAIDCSEDIYTGWYGE